MNTTRAPTFHAVFAEIGATFSAKFSRGSGGTATPPYTGEYRVTPKFEAVTLATKNLRMQEDVVVEPIPITEVSNPAGGITFIIGG